MTTRGSEFVDQCSGHPRRPPSGITKRKLRNYISKFKLLS